MTIFGEKTSLEDVLLPIARRYEADLDPLAGEISGFPLNRMARVAAADGRTMVVFALADCYPAGHQMAVSIGRSFRPCAISIFRPWNPRWCRWRSTVEQARELALPSTPIEGD